jgi:hypothetical protein
MGALLVDQEANRTPIGRPGGQSNAHWPTMTGCCGASRASRTSRQAGQARYGNSNGLSRGPETHGCRCDRELVTQPAPVRPNGEAPPLSITSSRTPIAPFLSLLTIPDSLKRSMTGRTPLRFPTRHHPCSRSPPRRRGALGWKRGVKGNGGGSTQEGESSQGNKIRHRWLSIRPRGFQNDLTPSKFSPFS